ncbi:hypothetical protein AV274_2759 [Blastocystis sp. ATCC 50177/Nand II]|uniref:Uncharacterized protein n=1 Tax=Blastocystis sp. subtype 1 (strain ATCC 50177 / NandII) TaxID=478820 RepID=A0A196SGT5_BLAHN|nr:hypothetical protein AV274_2759 [Blastocystis sp. ATCC 50177/Nand II]
MHPDERLRPRDYINTDVLKSAHGWAATNLFNKELKVQFDAFYTSPDTFLLALLGVKEEAMRQNCVALKCMDDGGSVATENWKVLVV